MKTASPRARTDRIADHALRIVLALHLLLFLSFALALATAAAARAETTACTGKDLIVKLARDHPQKLAAIRAEAEATPNGDGLLWKVEKDGVAPSYLFGTMHLADPRVANLLPEASRAYDASTTVAIETVEILDPQAPAKAMAERPDLMMFTDGRTLEKLLPADKIDGVRAALAKRGVPLAAVSRMKPWMLTSMVAMPACEMARKKAGAAFLDLKLAKDAKAQGKNVQGLETIVEQLDAMASLSLDFHIKGLVETLALGSRLDDMYETMLVLYTKGRIGMIMPMLQSFAPDDGKPDDGYAAFEQKMIDARNAVMASRAVPILDKGNAFIAVGALHLPGDKGLIERLRAKGYRISAVGD
ncbi:polysaccharide biosynthesis protein GumN [Phyllobacterium salinisoli]|uniref:Polysaccharide biosynthesis protein GumN n=1 Tax=Phyllobacterium salinisoli TaxID=1899321 RepID=A0A368K1P4_9HYPH|nr:TraB/GumN family protein [Phyllobacterium salinisoli]RCS22393.1 polysaccharide biosynthesis protein GumN [Phyllobacterium salinisoli]